MLPIVLAGTHSVSVLGPLDTGAAVNVLPYSMGAVWDQQPETVRLSGNLASHEARVLIVSAVVGTFSAVRLAFAWARTDDVPLILGQINFFLEFDVCFHRSRLVFGVRP